MIYTINENTIRRIIQESDLDSFIRSSSKKELTNLIGKPLNLVLVIEFNKLNPETRLIDKKYKKKRLEGQIEDILSWDLYSEPKILYKSDEGIHDLMFDDKKSEFLLDSYDQKNYVLPYQKTDSDKLDQFKKHFFGDDIMDAKTDMTEKWSQKYKRSIDCKNPKGFSQRAHCQGRKKRKN